ncbi:MAG: response regulator transcription factor [Myxococcales bacterium]
MVHVLLVDDHPLFHEGLASAFARLAPDLGIVSADSAEAGLAVLRREPIELALIDLVLPTLDGLSALALYAAEFPHIPRLLISGKDDPAIIARARDAGASGFLRKSLALDQLLAALRLVLDGGAYFDLGAPAPAPSSPSASERDPSGDLTLRQLEVLKLLGDGRSNKEISSALAIADRTVRAHLTELFRTLGVSSRTQAVLAAQRLGLLGAP